MSIRNLVIALAAAATLSIFAPPVQAGPVYSFISEGDFQATPGGEIEVKAFLQEAFENPGADFERNDLRLVKEYGLFSADVQVVQSDVSSASDPARLIGASRNPSFDPTYFANESSVADGKAHLIEGLDTFFSSPLTGVGPDGEGNVATIFLGTFRIQAGDKPGDTTHFTVQDYGTSGNTVTFKNGRSIDGAISSSTFTVTTIPAPGGVWVGLSGFAMLYLLAMRRPRRAAS